MGRKRKYSAISVHETMLGTLKVDWEQEYIAFLGLMRYTYPSD